MQIEAVLTPAEIAVLPQRDLTAVTCVVFDVLRATSTMLTAFANGARRIYPVSTVEEARELKGRLPDALLGGERHGVRIDGFDLGNSPLEYSAPVVSGRDIIATTTNGTVALRACAGAGEVLAGAWLNLDALLYHLTARTRAIDCLLLVCAGTGKRFALEDGLVAGALAAHLAWPGDDAAQALVSLYLEQSHDPLAVMQGSANGRRLAEIGLGADIAYCAADTDLPWIATLRAGIMEGQRAGPLR